jgi:hypothetical protein
MNVYNNLVTQSLNNLATLSMVVTDSQLRMSDAERLRAIDRIYADSHGQLDFLRRFNQQTQGIALQRANVAADKQGLTNLYGIN